MAAGAVPAALAVDSRNIEREPARIRTRKKRTAGFAADTANSFGPEEIVAAAAAAAAEALVVRAAVAAGDSPKIADSID